MTAGRRDQIVQLQRATRVADSGGGAAVTWSTIATLWAEVKPISGRERVQARQVESPAMYRVTIAWRDDVTEADRFLWNQAVGGPAVLNIRFQADMGLRPVELTFDCERGVAT